MPVRIALQEKGVASVRLDQGAVLTHVREMGEDLDALPADVEHPFEAPEPKAESLVALFVQLLPREHQYRVLEPGGADFVECLVVQRLAKIDPADRRPERGVHRFDPNTTRHVLPSRDEWGERRGLNPRPPEPQSGALPTELRPPSSTVRPRACRRPQIGTPGRIRTYDPRLRRPMLYPAELRALDTAGRRAAAPLPRAHPAAKNGRGRGIRTPDPLLPKQVRYQTAPYPAAVRRPGFRRRCGGAAR